MNPHTCKKCNKHFKTQEALQMHTKAVHASTEAKKHERSSTLRSFRNKAILLVVVLLVLFGGYWLFSQASGLTDVDPTTMNIGDHSNAAMHDHADLEIIIDGEEYLIPGDVGLSSTYMRPLHTHDTTGEIHIEGPFEYPFTVGDFFAVWGNRFDSTCIFDYCTDSGTLTMTVNGIPSQDYDNHVFADGERIVITYTSDEE